MSLSLRGMMVRFGWCAFLTVVADLQHFNLGLNSLRTPWAWLLLGLMISFCWHIHYYGVMFLSSHQSKRRLAGHFSTVLQDVPNILNHHWIYTHSNPIDTQANSPLTNGMIIKFVYQESTSPMSDSQETPTWMCANRPQATQWFGVDALMFFEEINLCLESSRGQRQYDLVWDFESILCIPNCLFYLPNSTALFPMFFGGSRHKSPGPVVLSSQMLGLMLLRIGH